MLGCRRGKSIGWHDHEPTIAEVLSDSIVKAVMSADGVDPEMLERELRSIARIMQVDRPTLRSSPRQRGPRDTSDQSASPWIPADAGMSGECGPS